jgi:hypothetical protein
VAPPLFAAAMTEKPSISYLNERVWYRLIKVVYIFGFVAFSLSGVAISYSEQMPLKKLVDNEKTIIACHFGNKGRYVAAANGIYFDTSDFEADYLPDHFRVRLKELCGISNEEVQQMLTFLDKSSTAERSAKNKLFDVEPAYVTWGGSLSFVRHAVLWLLGITLTFEVIRRAFYYIAIGKVFPKRS